jgi:hypothetical protein
MIMAIALDVPGITSRNYETRVDHGIGLVREKTFTVGRTVISMANIGSMRVIDQPRAVVMGFISGLVALWSGMGVLSSLFDSLARMMLPLTLPIAVVAGFYAYRCLFGELDVYLSIGTCDGYRTNLVSRDRTFLETIRDYLRRKIENPGDTTVATLNVSRAEFWIHTNVRIASSSGGVNVGDFSMPADIDDAATRREEQERLVG